MAWKKCSDILGYIIFSKYTLILQKSKLSDISLYKDFHLDTSNNLRMKLYVTWIQNWSDKSRTHFIVSFEKSSKIDNEVTTVLGYIIYSIYTPILQKNGKILILFRMIFYPRNIIHFNNVLINYK